MEQAENSALNSKKLLESAIESNLKMTYEARIEAHENARQLMIDLKRAGEEARAKSIWKRISAFSISSASR